MIYKTYWVGLSETSREGEIDLQHSRIQISRYWDSTPDQRGQLNRLSRRMRIGVAQSESYQGIRTCFGAQLRLRHAHGVASPLPRHSAPQGSPPLVQGRRWVVVVWENQREYDCGRGTSRSFFGRSEADYTSSPSGALHGFDGGRTRFLVTLRPRRQRLPSGDPT